MGALLPVCGVGVLIVAVKPFVIADAQEANLYMTAFQMRFGCEVVLMSRHEAATYYGSPSIVDTLSRLPLELIPWQQIAFRAPKLRSWRLPIPADPPDEDAANSDLVHTRIFDRMARTTRR